MRYLEARLIALANAAKRAEIANGTAPPNPSLSEAETADVESFLRDMLLIFPLLEVNAFQLTAASPLPASNNVTPAAVDALLYLKGPSAEATGLDTPEGFIVKAGSKARAASVPSIHKWLVDLRDTLLAQGILSAQGEQLVLTQDYAFDSPSSAAGALLGRAANGRVEWKAEDGKTLKELQVASITADPSEKTTAHPDREAQRSQSGLLLERALRKYHRRNRECRLALRLDPGGNPFVGLGSAELPAGRACSRRVSTIGLIPTQRLRNWLARTRPASGPSSAPAPLTDIVSPQVRI